MNKAEFNGQFARIKKMGFRDFQEGTQDMANIDPEIRPHVNATNALPYAMTLWSCSGHLRDYTIEKDPIRNPDGSWGPRSNKTIRPLGKPTVFIGHMVLLLNHSRQSDALIEEIKKLARDFPCMLIEKPTGLSRELEKNANIEVQGENVGRILTVRFHTLKRREKSTTPEETERIHNEQVQVREALLKVLQKAKRNVWWSKLASIFKRH